MNLNVITRRKLMVMIGLSYRTKETKVDKEQRTKIKKQNHGKNLQGDLKIIVDDLLDLYNNPQPIIVQILPNKRPPLYYYYLLVQI